MSRPLKWILAIIGVFLVIFSLYTIYISGKPAFDSSNILGWAGFGTGLFVLLFLLYYLDVRVGIAYTIILLLLLLFAIGLEKIKPSYDMEQLLNEIAEEKDSEEVQQLDENGNVIIDHPYDTLISLQWGTNNNVDMDIMLIDKKNNIFVNFNTARYIVNDSNSIWLDYDYQRQKDIAHKEIISILGMKENTFSVIVMNYNGETLTQDVLLEISHPDETTTTYTLPATLFNDDTKSVHVCDITMNTDTIKEFMDDL